MASFGGDLDALHPDVKTLMLLVTSVWGIMGAGGVSMRLAAILGGDEASMNSVNLATALHRLARCAAGNDSVDAPLLDALCERAGRALHPSTCTEKITARSLTSIAWAIGKLQLSHAGLLEAFGAQASSCASSCRRASCSW